MNRLDRFRYGNLHKRRMTLLGVIFLSIFILASGILAFLGIFGVRSELVRIKVTDQVVGNISNGVGINLDYIPVVNRVRDPSFEYSSGYVTYSVADCSENYIYMNLEEGSEFIPATGSTVNILSSDNTGAFNQSFTSTVTGFREAGLGSLVEIADANSLWTGNTFTKTTVVGNVVVGLTDDGRVISDIMSDSLSSVISGEDSFVDVAAFGNGLYALSSEGILYYSADAGLLMPLSEASLLDSLGNDEELLNVQILQASGQIGVLANDSLWLYADGCFVNVSSPWGEDVVAASSGSRVLFADSDGRVYDSFNMIAFRLLDISLEASAIDVVESEGNFYIITDDGNATWINYSDDEVISSTFDVWYSAGKGDSDTVSEVSAITAVDAGRGNIVVISDTGDMYLVSGNKESSTPIVSGSRRFDKVLEGANTGIICVSETELFSTRVLSGIQVADYVPETGIMDGDLCFIEVNNSSVSLNAESNQWVLSGENSYWDCFGEGTVALVTDGNLVNGGNSCLKLSGMGEGTHVVSQDLSGTSSEIFTEDSFYRIELQMRGDNTNVPVQIWISGEGFEQVGFTVSNLTNKFASYSYVFAVTDSMLASDSGLSLNIAFDGQGSIFVDNVYLGEDRYTDNCIPSDIRNAIVDASPAAIRFNNLNIGQSGFSEEAFYGVSAVSSCMDLGDVSLEDALLISRDAGSSPWLVLGSYTSATDIDALMEYICGSVSTEYGRIRVDNGTAIPWSRQFSTIYIEIGDTDNCYEGDVRKGAFVNFVINRILHSEYYSELRDKIVFVDGMNYDGGIVLSSAYFHCSDLEINRTDENGVVGDMNTAISDALNLAAESTPRISGHSTDSGEFISSMSLNNAEYLNLMTASQLISSSLVSDYRMVMLDCEFSSISSDIYGISNNGALFNTLKSLSFINHSDDMYYEITEPMDESSEQSVESFNENCRVSYISENNVLYLIVTNVSSVQQQFMIEGVNIEINNAVADRYSSDGTLIRSRNIRSISPRQNLQPGEYMIIAIGE